MVAHESKPIEISIQSSREDDIMIENQEDDDNAFVSRVRLEAWRGGISGALGGAAQVILLMWLRTTVNYQCKYSVSIGEAMRILYNDGGILRFYQGVSFALIQGPLARFGAVAANEAAKEISRKFRRQDGIMFSTALGAVMASLWRVLLMPIDTCKTVLQVEGTAGYNRLLEKVWTGDILCLYQGTIATVLTTLVGHYPWFVTYNWLEHHLPKSSDVCGNLMRNASIGFLSSTVSDVFANVLRVIKTVKQSTISSTNPTYSEVIMLIYNEEGLSGLFGRGLFLRIITNGFQSILFILVWKWMSDLLRRRSEKEKHVV